MTTISEIAPDVFSICTYIEQADLQFRQFLIRDEQPLLYHTGTRRMFERVRDAVGQIMDPKSVRWVAFSHFEADECGALNYWLQEARDATRGLQPERRPRERGRLRVRQGAAARRRGELLDRFAHPALSGHARTCRTGGTPAISTTRRPASSSVRTSCIRPATSATTTATGRAGSRHEGDARGHREARPWTGTSPVDGADAGRRWSGWRSSSRGLRDDARVRVHRRRRRELRDIGRHARGGLRRHGFD